MEALLRYVGGISCFARSPFVCRKHPPIFCESTNLKEINGLGLRCASAMNAAQNCSRPVVYSVRLLREATVMADAWLFGDLPAQGKTDAARHFAGNLLVC